MKILNHICVLTILLIVFTILLSCSNELENTDSNLEAGRNIKISDSNTNQFAIAEFERNRNLWTSKNIQNYKMIIGASGFITNFPEEVLIEVKNRQAKSIKSLSETGRNYTEAYNNYDTVEKIFDFIENGKKADKLQVIYNEYLGYPKQVLYDGHIGVADDELKLQVKKIEVIN